jgi:hypothetical protein
LAVILLVLVLVLVLRPSSSFSSSFSYSFSHLVRRPTAFEDEDENEYDRVWPPIDRRWRLAIITRCFKVFRRLVAGREE